MWNRVSTMKTYSFLEYTVTHSYPEPSHLSSSLGCEWSIRLHSNNFHPSTSFQLVLHVIFGLPRLLLPLGGPGESNSAVVVFLSPRDVTDPSQSPELHSLRDGTVSSSFIEFTVGDGAWPKYAKDSPQTFSVESIQALNVCWCYLAYLSVLQENRGHKALEDSQLGVLAVHLWPPDRI